MKTVEYIVNCIIEHGATDVFGIPGGIVLDFLYELKRQKDRINVHLSYHEQAAGLAACSYGQASGRLGVAYSTRGPGITNMITAIAEAYYESSPCLFITAHTGTSKPEEMRILDDQELDAIPLVRGIVKYAVRIDNLENVKREVAKACHIALSGRKGPVVIDIKESLYNMELPNDSENDFTKNLDSKDDEVFYDVIQNELKNSLCSAKRPVVIIGEGIRTSGSINELLKFTESNKIPILSSRCSQDIGATSPYYFGYIGSHGIRYANFILSKADLIIVLGNRMSFPVISKSFRTIFCNAKTIRIEMDGTELLREIPNSKAYQADVKKLLSKVSHVKMEYQCPDEWLEVCHVLKRKLEVYDVSPFIKHLGNILDKIPNSVSLTSDVGNNEFWLSRAYEMVHASNYICYSRSFGVLGCSLPKAIGVYYALRKPVVCFTGDQGIQLNIQELQVLSSEKPPIAIIVINNRASGMIRSREILKKKPFFVHTTEDSGYGEPLFDYIARAYQIKYYRDDDIKDYGYFFKNLSEPVIIELNVDETEDLELMLPKGNKCQNLEPLLPEELYQNLEEL